MKIDTDELKSQIKKEATQLASLAKKQAESFHKNQWPTIKAAIAQGANKVNKATDGKGQEILKKSKQVFKDGVRALDQKVNGSSVHRDKNEDE
ncbi:hypothetical protein FP435_06585 [Lactobacillus sp. PV037]|uniref:hypothetical protein n=1 Tax=unclassified Lactobacillus TaxID=2620435 RepID=UPI002240A1E2|nr:MULTISPECIES: hypothetical protein [unclassified Lactobacillus]QNQ81852.1 hypothetical protein FP433_01660 [Lactobacillus sp. PV012]QNQ84109.1 hypothetical protein FP435_06585 [Lactobacillus sp. PV037]